MKYLSLGGLVIAVAILAGCGGGGSDSGTPPVAALTVIGDVSVPKVVALPPNNGAFSFDLVYVDQGQNTAYFTDRNSKSIDKVTYATLPATLAAQLTAGGAFAGCQSAAGVAAPDCTATAPPAIAATAFGGPNGLNGLPGTPNLYAGDIQKVVALNSTTGALIANIPHTNPVDGNTGVRTDEGCLLPAASSPIAGVAILAYSNNGEPSKTIGAQTRGRTFYTFTRLDTNAIIGQMVMPNSIGQEQCLFDLIGPTVQMLWTEDGDGGINNGPNTILGTNNPDGALDNVDLPLLITAFAAAPVSAVNGNKFLILDTAANVTADIALGFYPAGSTAVPVGIWTRRSGFNTSLVPPTPAGAGCTPTGLAAGNGTDVGVNCRPALVGVPTIMMIFNRKTGGAPKAIVNAGGGDQLAFDVPTNAYYSAAARWTAGTVSPNSCAAAANRLCSPVLQVVDGTAYTVRARIPTGNNAHGVDVDSAAGLAFLPYSNATQPLGCLPSACAAFPNGGIHVVKIR